MTLNELAELSADKLEALSPSELDAILSPYYHVTRPEQIVHKSPITVKQEFMTPQKKAIFAALQAEGIDMSLFQKKKGKK